MTNPSDPTPEAPGMTDPETAERSPAAPGTRRDEEAAETDGQVSEVGRLDEDAAATPVAPEDSTAGYPASESGDPDFKGTGPDGVPPENRRDNDFKKSSKARPDERVEDL
jgi:hypothetical protein